MNIQAAIQQVIDRRDLDGESMRAVMRAVMTGECTPAQIAGFLVALRMKEETVEEIAAAAEVMRDLAVRVEVGKDHLVDTCGTGGDGANTFNISTTAALVAAAAGARVAKHGNRSVSGKSGSADVLEAAGVKLDLAPEQIARCIDEIGIGFMFAPLHHGAMKHALGPRRELGVRTLFNILGPLTNPAGAPNQVVGVYSDAWRGKLARVLQKLGSTHVIVVHSEDGMDEISVSAPTRITELQDGELKDYSITPEQFGLRRAAKPDLAVQDTNDSLKLMYSVLDNRDSAARDIVILNAGAAVYTAGVAENLEAGVMLSSRAIESGAARARLAQLVELTNGF